MAQAQHLTGWLELAGELAEHTQPPLLHKPPEALAQQDMTEMAETLE
jgi:hypothetical protein